MNITYTNAVTKIPGTNGPLEKELLNLAPYAAALKVTHTPAPAPREAEIIQFPFAPL